MIISFVYINIILNKIYIYIYTQVMSVEPHLLPTHSEAIFNSMQTERTVTRIAFNPSTTNPGDVLYVTVSKLAQDVVMCLARLP